MSSPDPGCASSEDVFKRFADSFERDDDGDISAFALLAYALVERDRVDWLEHLAQKDGTPPTAAKVANWFEDKPESYFSDKERIAVNWFTEFAREALSEEIEQTAQNAIADTIGNLRRFWPGFWVGNLIGITSNIAFALLVVLFVVVINTDFSFVAWARKIFGFH